MNVVITGSTRGIGRGMALEFSQRGHPVVISGRRQAAVDRVVAEINRLSPGTASGWVCDVGSFDAVQSLWDHALGRFGEVDIWINNAGATHRKLQLGDIPPEQIPAVVTANLSGLLYGCRVAIAGMLAQGHGRLFNLEGFGSDGMVQSGMSVYGATKSAVSYLTKSLVREYRDTPLIIARMSPGIVVTDLLLKDLHDTSSDDFATRRRFLNILADRVETVAPHLVEGALAVSRTGQAVRWMTPAQALGRLIKSPFAKRDVLGPAGGKG